jgi:hypothetical protein
MSKYVQDNEWGTKYPNFKKNEFKCPCGKCNGYGKGIASSLVKTLQDLRNKYGNGITITSGYRCSSHNKKVGGTTNSKHTQGLAADFYMSGFNSQSTRVNVINELKKTKYYRYAYCNVNGNYPNMGNVVHIDTKLVDTDEKKTYTGTFPTLPSRGYFKKGDTGTQVKNLQKFLNWSNDCKLGVDGVIGNNTISQVKAFQKKVNLTQDGLFGKTSLSKAKSYKK